MIFSDPNKEKLEAALAVEREMRISSERRQAELHVSNQLLKTELDYCQKQLEAYNEKLSKYKEILKSTLYAGGEKRLKLSSPLLTEEFAFVHAFDAPHHKVLPLLV